MLDEEMGRRNGKVHDDIRDADPAFEDLPGDFQRRPSGIYRAEKAGKEIIDWAWICSPLWIDALARDSKGGGWGRYLRFLDPDGRKHQWPMPSKALADNGLELRSYLLDHGLNLATGSKARSALLAFIAAQHPQKRLRSVAHGGWSDPAYSAFVLDERVIGKAAGESVVVQAGTVESEIFSERGTLQGWKKRIGSRCIGNRRLQFVTSAALLGPLCAPLQIENPFINLIGLSSLGKTTAQLVAASAWYPPSSIVPWNSTAIGLQAVTGAYVDNLLILDEMSEAAPHVVSAAAYFVANGRPRLRADRSGKARLGAMYHLVAISSSELPLNEKVTEAGGRSKAGQETRCIDLPADTGVYGIFEELHAAASADEFSKDLKEATGEEYGTAGPAFLEKIIERGVVRVAETVRQLAAEALESYPIKGADGQITRTARKFALIGATGEVATSMGVLPWSKDEATVAATRCFEAWLMQRGSIGPLELVRGVRQVRKFFEANSSSRFALAEGNDERTVVGRVGFRRLRKDDASLEYLVLPESFKNELCVGFDAAALAKELVRLGCLTPDKSGKTSTTRKIPAIDKNKSTRVYAFTSQIFETVGATEDDAEI
jgi:putative DNA primase/helicase